MAESLDPNIILAQRPVTYEPLAAAQLRQQAIQEGKLGLQTGAQNLQIGGENLQALKYANQERATQLQEQQTLLQAQRDEIAARAAAANPAASPVTPVAPAPTRTPEGLIVRDPNAAPIADPSARVIPGIVGVTTGSSVEPAAAPTGSVLEGMMRRAEGKVRPSTFMALQSQMLGTKEKLATINKTTADAAEAQQKVQDAHADAIAALFKPVQDSGYSLPTVSFALAHMHENGFGQEADNIQRAIQANPDNIKPIIDSLLSQASAARITAGARAVTAGSGAQKQENEAPTQVAAANQATRINTAQQLLSAPDAGTYYQMLAKVPRDQRALLPDFEDPNRAAALRQYAMTPEQQTTAAIQLGAHEETARHNLSDESLRRVSNAISAGHLAQSQMVNGLKYGPGTQEYWVKQLTDNPDSIKEMPAELRSSVGQAFRQTTGLPLPTPISATTQAQETAARNALDNAAFVQNALKNPEIRANIGPIMGRLGNAEQAVGAAPNLSPQAAQLAQELRTRMRYLVFSEGKAVLGGRMPQELMHQLESSSPNVRMTPNMLAGALSGVTENARSVMDNADKQRFGGQMRSRELRGIATPSQTAPPKTNPFR